MEHISEVYNCDCMEYMKTIPDNFFELAIVDPPYGIKASKMTMGLGVKKWKKTDWDSSTPDREYFEELFRISKNQIIWGGNYFTNNLPQSRCWLSWNKEVPMGMSFADFELAWTSFDEVSREVRLKYSGIAQAGKYEEKIHPTQKPVILYFWILKHYANVGDKIFDSHLGSGSSRIAAYKLGFDFYSTEIDKGYFESQEERFRRECFGEITLPNGKKLIQTSLF